MAKTWGRLGRTRTLGRWSVPAYASGARSFAAEVDFDAMSTDVIVVGRDTIHPCASVWPRRPW